MLSPHLFLLGELAVVQRGLTEGRPVGTAELLVDCSDAIALSVLDQMLSVEFKATVEKPLLGCVFEFGFAEFILDCFDGIAFVLAGSSVNLALQAIKPYFLGLTLGQVDTIGLTLAGVRETRRSYPVWPTG